MITMASFKRQGLKATVATILECAVCLDTFKIPKTLSCGHSFCKSCLADMLKPELLKGDLLEVLPLRQLGRLGLNLVCPKCKKQCDPFNSLDEIVTNHVINQLLEAKTYEDAVVDNKPPSCTCGENAKLQCYRCKDVYCNHCSKEQMGKFCSAQKYKVTGFTQCKMKHFFIKLEPQEDGSLCKDHSLPLEFYCKDCKKAICMDCFLISHGQHEARAIRFARKEALSIVETIQSLKNDHASKSNQMHQETCKMQSVLERSERNINDKLDNLEGRLHGLISSLFNKAKMYYGGVIGLSKGMLQETISHCRRSNHQTSASDWDAMTDLELACLLHELIHAKKEEEKQARLFEEKEMLHLRSRFHNELRMHINEEAIFELVLSFFKHIELDPPRAGTFLPHDFTFDAYQSGEYLGISKEETEIARRPITIQKEERITYSRDFLLKFQDYSVRPHFMEQLECISYRDALPETMRRSGPVRMKKVRSEQFLRRIDNEEEESVPYVAPAPYLPQQQGWTPSIYHTAGIFRHTRPGYTLNLQTQSQNQQGPQPYVNARFFKIP